MLLNALRASLISLYSDLGQMYMMDAGAFFLNRIVEEENGVRAARRMHCGFRFFNRGTDAVRQFNPAHAKAVAALREHIQAVKTRKQQADQKSGTSGAPGLHQSGSPASDTKQHSDANGPGKRGSVAPSVPGEPTTSPVAGTGISAGDASKATPTASSLPAVDTGRRRALSAGNKPASTPA